MGPRRREDPASTVRPAYYKKDDQQGDQCLVCSVFSFFCLSIKYPEDLDLIDVADPWVPESGGHFCIARDKTVEVDEPELAKVMEEQMERHLFGEEHDPKARTLRCNLCGGDSYV